MNPDSSPISLNFQENDKPENSLRPNNLSDFVGQQKVIDNLLIFIKSALKRESVLDHILLSGPPGLGKTSLAYIVSNEMNTTIRATSGPVIEKQGDLAAILTSL